jgi:hypothetical protein
MALAAASAVPSEAAMNLVQDIVVLSLRKPAGRHVTKCNNSETWYDA